MAKKKCNGYWTKERVMEEAQKYTLLSEFTQKSMSAYKVASNNGWLAELPLVRTVKPAGYWTKALCALEACKYSSRIEFNTGNNPAYHAACINGWLDSICRHMLVGWGVQKDRPRYVYVISAKDSYGKTDTYVGLSMRVLDRIGSHKSCGKEEVRRLLQRHNVTIKVANRGKSLPEPRAARLEKYLITKYINQGHKVLNTAKAGGLGGCPPVKWTKEAVMKEARRFRTRAVFKKSSRGAYGAASKMAIMEECCSHMRGPKNLPGHWTKEKCSEEALRYDSRFAFQRGSRGAYGSAHRNDWLDDVCRHMEVSKCPS